jgi:ubiquinone/menaquinone biosynthesis C-methylase UbiE
MTISPGNGTPRLRERRQVRRPDPAALKQGSQATWASGDFAVIGTTLQIVGELLAETADVRAGERVLDVAAGNGNVTLAAARRFATVTSTDLVPALLDKAKARAAAEGLDVTFRVADAEALPFADASFDAVLSTFGVMFAPDHRRAAHEMWRVVRAGGRIAMANWTPEGFLGELLRLVARHVPPPPGVQSSLAWGTEAHLSELFGGALMKVTRRQFNFRYASPEHWLQVFRDYYGPAMKAFAALDLQGQMDLERDMLELLRRSNTAGAAALVVPSEYLEVVIIKPAS